MYCLMYFFFDLIYTNFSAFAQFQLLQQQKSNSIILSLVSRPAIFIKHFIIFFCIAMLMSFSLSLIFISSFLFLFSLSLLFISFMSLYSSLFSFSLLLSISLFSFYLFMFLILSLSPFT